MDNDQTPREPSRDEVIEGMIEDLEYALEIYQNDTLSDCSCIQEEINELKRGLSDHAC